MYGENKILTRPSSLPPVELVYGLPGLDDDSEIFLRSNYTKEKFFFSSFSFFFPFPQRYGIGPSSGVRVRGEGRRDVAEVRRRDSGGFEDHVVGRYAGIPRLGPQFVEEHVVYTESSGTVIGLV